MLEARNAVALNCGTDGPVTTAGIAQGLVGTFAIGVPLLVRTFPKLGPKCTMFHYSIPH